MPQRDPFHSLKVRSSIFLWQRMHAARNPVYVALNRFLQRSAGLYKVEEMRLRSVLPPLLLIDFDHVETQITQRLGYLFSESRAIQSHQYRRGAASQPRSLQPLYPTVRNSEIGLCWSGLRILVMPRARQ